MSFSALPYELRTWVWELAIVPRTIHVHGLGKYPNRSAAATPIPAPAVLHACREARDYLIRRKFYTPAFPSTRKNGEQSYTWINFEHDRISLDDSHLDYLEGYEHLIQNLNLGPGNDPEEGDPSPKFTRLKTLHVYDTEVARLKNDTLVSGVFLGSPVEVTRIDPMCGMMMTVDEYHAWDDWVMKNSTFDFGFDPRSDYD